jgi:hypothetical protein
MTIDEALLRERYLWLESLTEKSEQGHPALNKSSPCLYVNRVSTLPNRYLYCFESSWDQSSSNEEY